MTSHSKFQVQAKVKINLEVFFSEIKVAIQSCQILHLSLVKYPIPLIWQNLTQSMEKLGKMWQDWMATWICKNTSNIFTSVFFFICDSYLLHL